jgi:methionyl-tRNA formyltransferase
LGTGQLACYCAQLASQEGIDVMVFDTNRVSSPMLSAACKRAGIKYAHLSPLDTADAILAVKDTALLISAVNPWLIPEKVLDKPGTKAINLHHALLPKHPGRNAEAWAIYEGDKESGITWHFIVPKVDAGDIIIRSGVELSDKITSIQLLKNQDQLARQTFKNILPDLLDDKIVGLPQRRDKTTVQHFSWQIPNNGYIDLNWTGQQISRFLRAMDYGVAKTLGVPKVALGQNVYSWAKYIIKDTKEYENTATDEIKDEDLIIHRQDSVFILKNLKRMG